MTTLEKKWFAIGCAEVVLSIYEAKYPDNKAPREAIEAAKDYLNDKCTIEFLKEKRSAAAYAAAAAADSKKVSYKDALLVFMKNFVEASVENNIEA